MLSYLQYHTSSILPSFINFTVNKSKNLYRLHPTLTSLTRTVVKRNRVLNPTVQYLSCSTYTRLDIILLCCRVFVVGWWGCTTSCSTLCSLGGEIENPDQSSRSRTALLALPLSLSLFLLAPALETWIWNFSKIHCWCCEGETVSLINR